jgi:hypothetical protein
MQILCFVLNLYLLASSEVQIIMYIRRYIQLKIIKISRGYIIFWIGFLLSTKKNLRVLANCYILFFSGAFEQIDDWVKCNFFLYFVKLLLTVPCSQVKVESWLLWQWLENFFVEPPKFFNLYRDSWQSSFLFLSSTFRR